MQKVVGIPVGDLAVVLTIALGVVGGAVAVLALRHRILLRLSLRNLTRRRGRTALIVAGLMLGTTIICSALVTGDTISRTIRASVVQTLGQTDELVAVRGAESETPEFFAASHFGAVDRELRATGLVDGTAPAIIVPVAVQDARSRQTEARVSLYAPDPAHMAGFGPIRTTAGRTVSLAGLGPSEVYLNADAADELQARAGDRLQILSGVATALVSVAAIVEHDGTGTDGAAVLLPLARAQARRRVPPSPALSCARLAPSWQRSDSSCRTSSATGSSSPTRKATSSCRSSRRSAASRSSPACC
jgi:ABC-type lipoprotein release transport system permease subunit